MRNGLSASGQVALCLLGIYAVLLLAIAAPDLYRAIWRGILAIAIHLGAWK